MARLAAGDRDALEPLMARHYKRMYRIALGYLRNPEDALDVVQETFVKAFSHASRWDGASEVAPWLCRIAVNQSIDRYRRNKRRRASFAPLEEGDHQETLAAPGISPERRALSSEIGAEVARALEGLPETAARGVRAPPLPGHEPRGDRGHHGARPGHGQEQPAPRRAPPARAARGPSGAGMILEHLRRRRSVTLLATGALSGSEAAAAHAHLERCARCRAEHDEVAALLARLSQDPLLGAEPELPLHVLVEQVQARVSRTLTSPKAVLGWRLLAVPVAAAAALVAGLVVPPLVREFRSEPRARQTEAPVVSEDALLRLEHTVAREQAARYLAEAQDVLVNVAASSRDCERPRSTTDPRVDLEAEARRSRELLARKSLLVEADEAAVMSAGPVLEDVADMLREVADLEACTRERDLERLRERLDRRQLLMKMRLMERELLG